MTSLLLSARSGSGDWPQSVCQVAPLATETPNRRQPDQGNPAARQEGCANRAAVDLLVARSTTSTMPVPWGKTPTLTDKRAAPSCTPPRVRVAFAALRTLVLDPPPADFQELLKRRRRWGADTHDEVWEGVLHMAPAPSGAHAELEWQLAVLLAPLATAAGLTASGQFNLGAEADYRVPDGGLHRQRPQGVWQPTAALAIEIISPDDETWDKLPFYANHHVNELLIVDPDKRTIHWLALDEPGDYQPIDHSQLIDLNSTQLAKLIDWPT